MKIIHVLNHYLPQQTAGTEVYTHALCKYLQNRNIVSTVIIPNKGQFISDGYTHEGIYVYQYSEPSIVDRSLIMGFRFPDGLKSFGSYLESAKPNVIHFHELAGSNGVTLEHVKLAKTMGFKVILTFHLAGYSCMTGTLIHYAGKLCNGLIDEHLCGECYLKQKGMGLISYPLARCSQALRKMGVDSRKMDHPIGTLLGTANIIGKLKGDLIELVILCDQVVCLTNWYRDILLKNGIDAKKIRVIEQGLPIGTEEIINCSVFTQKEKPLKLMFLGRISKFKGLHLLLDALAIFPKNKVELAIYGNSEEGDYENNLRNQTVERSNVHWMGKLKQTNVISTMTQHHILCLCSTFSEMSPLVIQEAKAAGMPVLASNVYGNSEQIKHGINGLLFDFNSIDSLKQQIQRLISEPNLLGELRSNITQPKSFDVVGREYVELYESILQK